MKSCCLDNNLPENFYLDNRTDLLLVRQANRRVLALVTSTLGEGDPTGGPFHGSGRIHTGQARYHVGVGADELSCSEITGDVEFLTGTDDFDVSLRDFHEIFPYLSYEVFPEAKKINQTYDKLPTSNVVIPRT